MLPAILLFIAAFAGVLAVMPASAQTSSGQFNPQTQFAVGTKVQITSIYGLEMSPPQFPTANNGPQNFGNHTWRSGGQNGNSQTPPNGPMNQEWNLAYLRNTPITNSSLTINAEVTNDTSDGGVIWTIQGGTITYNGTTLTVTGGKGGVGKLNRIIMLGNATDSNGNTLRWSLEGLATLYNGTVIVSLTGNVAQPNQSTTAPRHPGQRLEITRGVSLTYIATLT
jgi:hypothetical protein